jgi:hypothetical protein
LEVVGERLNQPGQQGFFGHHPFGRAPAARQR